MHTYFIFISSSLYDTIDNYSLIFSLSIFNSSSYMYFLVIKQKLLQNNKIDGLVYYRYVVVWDMKEYFFVQNTGRSRRIGRLLNKEVRSTRSTPLERSGACRILNIRCYYIGVNYYDNNLSEGKQYCIVTCIASIFCTYDVPLLKKKKKKQTNNNKTKATKKDKNKHTCTHTLTHTTWNESLLPNQKWKSLPPRLH